MFPLIKEFLPEELRVRKDEIPIKSVLKPFVSFDPAKVEAAGNSMLQLVSSLHTSRLTSLGYVAEAEYLGIESYAINAQLDIHVCGVCRAMHGRVFRVSEARRALDEILAVDDPNELKALQPWPKHNEATIKELVNSSSAQLSGRNLHLSPYHAGCYADGTLVYTSRGFIDFKEVDIKKDQFLSMNPDTMDLEWVSAVAEIHYLVDRATSISNRQGSIRMLVSDNHPMFYRRRMGNGAKGRSYVFKFSSIDEFRKRNQARNGVNAIYCSSAWVGHEVETLSIAGSQFPADAFLRFLGYYLSEGSVNTKHLYPIIHQEKHFSKMWTDVEQLGLPLTRWGDKIVVKDIDLGLWLMQFGHSARKHVPGFLKKLSRRQIRVFLDAFALGDGSTLTGGCFGYQTSRRVYYTSSIRLRDDLVELILRAGYSAAFKLDKPKGTMTKHCNGEYSSNHDSWVISQLSSASRRAPIIESVPYTGMVHDVELEKNHTLLVSYQGTVFWGSNCRCIIVRTTDVPSIEQTASFDAAARLNPGIRRYVPTKWDFIALGLPGDESVLARWAQSTPVSPREVASAILGVNKNLVTADLLKSRGVSLTIQDDTLKLLGEAVSVPRVAAVVSFSLSVPLLGSTAELQVQAGTNTQDLLKQLRRSLKMMGITKVNLRVVGDSTQNRLVDVR